MSIGSKMLAESKEDLLRGELHVGQVVLQLRLEPLGLKGVLNGRR